MPYSTLRRFFCYTFVCIAVFASCTQDVDDVVPPPPDDTTSTSIENLPAGWKKTKLDTDDYIIDVIFYGDTGYCYARKNLYRSLDGGDNWEKVLFSPKFFGNLGMGSAKNAIILSAYGLVDLPSTIYYTKDGGATFDSLIFQDQVTDVFFVNKETAFLIGRKFWKTVDGGASWQQVFNFNDEKGEYRSLYFLDETNGFISKYDGVFSTDNGGITWNKIGLEGPAPEKYLGSIFFYNSEIGFSTGLHQIGRFNAGDFTMQFYYSLSNYGTSSYHDLHFVSADTGYVTNGRRIMKTTDRGISWKVELTSLTGEFCELHFTDPDHGWAGSENGTIYKYVKP